MQSQIVMPCPSRTTSMAAVLQSLQLRPEPCNTVKRVDTSINKKQDVQEMHDYQLQWQSASHLSERRMMVQRILQLSQSHSKSDVNPDRAVLLTKRIELALYSRAGSLTEYCNLATLRRRLQSLVASSVYEAVASETMVHQTRKRRGMSQSSMQEVSRLTKRRRRTYVAATSSHIFSSMDEDCTRLVFSFLDGKEVMRQRMLNRFAAAFLPRCVQCLTVNVAQFAQAMMVSCSSILWLTNLEQLVVHKAGALSKVGSATTPLYARSCTELPANELNDGETAVVALSSALSFGTFSNLKKLQLNSVFVNTISRNGLFTLCNALERGCCPRLEDLLLAGNNLGDLGAYGVARLLLSPQAPRLTRLDLRRNFMGETGLRAVVNALIQTQPSLQVLCMGGNLITDNCVSELQTLLASSACPTLQFLGLEDNFLSAEGVQVILQTTAARNTLSTRSRRVSCDRNTFA